MGLTIGDINAARFQSLRERAEAMTGKKYPDSDWEALLGASKGRREWVPWVIEDVHGNTIDNGYDWHRGIVRPGDVLVVLGVNRHLGQRQVMGQRVVPGLCQFVKNV